MGQEEFKKCFEQSQEKYQKLLAENTRLRAYVRGTPGAPSYPELLRENEELKTEIAALNAKIKKLEGKKKKMVSILVHSLLLDLLIGL